MVEGVAVQKSKLFRVLDVLEPIVLVALPIFLFLCVILDIPNPAIISTVAAIVSLIPFFAHFELAHLRARDVMPIVVMSALAVAGRLIFAPIPAVKPVMAIVVITGIAFGRETGFITGSMAMLVSNIFFGQGPWTPWQMYGFGLSGYLSGVLGEKGMLKRRMSIAFFGFLMVYLFGFILDTWTIVGFLNPITIQGIITTYVAGLSYNFVHALSTSLFLLPIAVSWPKMFDRIKRKYGIGSPTLREAASEAVTQ